VRILSTDPDQPGIFAVGQFATGIFAFGQMATGVIAIGQLARGVVAVGQLAVGFVAIGQVCGAVVWGGGMVGITGRGFGFVIKTLPKYRPDLGTPEGWSTCGTLADVREKGMGTIRASIRGHALFTEDGQALDATPSELVATQLAQLDDQNAIVHLTSETIQRDDGTYREAPHQQTMLRALALTPWKRWPWPLEAITGTGCAPLWQVLLRAFVLIELIIGWHFIAGAAILEMFR
jgi:hypothetical protein